MKRPLNRGQNRSWRSVAKEFPKTLTGQTISARQSISRGAAEGMWKSFILEIGGSNHRPTRKVAQHISDIHEAGVDAIGQTFRGTEGELAFF